MHNIVITGGSSGFGKAMTYEFCKKKHNVLITGRSVKPLIETKYQMYNNTNGQCEYKQCDVQNKDDLINLADYAKDIFNGKIDHWINNAGVCEGPEDFQNISLEDTDNVIQTNILGVILGTKIAQNIQCRNIYAISGHGSDFMKTPDFAVYGASKACISQFYSSLIEETKKSTTNNQSKFHIIAPGIMKSNLSKKLLEDEDMNRLQKYMIGILAQDPSDVAMKVVPKIIAISGNGNTIRPIF
jgi:short-subunit dehydrogenase